MRGRIGYLSLGANLGARAETIREALRRLACAAGIRLLRVSSLYETAPWGRIDQPAFLNAAAVIETDLSPLALLAACQSVERALGRVRHEHWGARTIDVDILHVEGVQMADARLCLPHPYMMERAFVLVPLAEIAPALAVCGEGIGAALARMAGDGQEVRLAREVSAPWPLRLIACVDAARGIGRGGRLLARIPEDMARFRRLTMGGALIMGRRTMESLPRRAPLAGRVNLVLSRTLAGRGAEGFAVCRDLAELWRRLGELHDQNPAQSFWCIGGAEVYAALLPYVREAYLTEIAGTHGADAFLPPLAGFLRVSQEAGERCTFSHYVREAARFLGMRSGEDGDFS